MRLSNVIRALVAAGRLCVVVALLAAAVCNELVSWAEALERRNAVLEQLRHAPNFALGDSGGRQ